MFQDIGALIAFSTESASFKMFEFWVISVQSLIRKVPRKLIGRDEMIGWKR